MKNISLIISFLILSTQLLAFDIVGERKAIIIKQHPTKPEFQNLKACLITKKSEVIQNSCHQIGSKEYYSKAFLKRLRVDEYIEASLKTLADVGIVIAMIYGGAFVVGSGALGSELFLTIGATGGAMGGGLSGVAITGFVKKLNPVRQFQQASVLSDEIVNDIDIKKSDKKIEKIIELLNEIL